MADRLSFVDCVVGYTDLNPPVASTNLLRMTALVIEKSPIRMLDRPGWQLEWRRPPHVFCLEVYGVAHDVAVRFSGRVRLIELCPTLATHAPFAACLRGHDAVTSAVNKNFRLQRKVHFSVANAALYGLQYPARYNDGKHSRIQMQRQIRRLLHQVVDDDVPHRICPAIFEDGLMIHSALFNQQFRYDPGLTCVCMERGSTMRSDTHFRRAVATEHRSILHQACLRARARRRNRCTDSRQTTTAHHYVVLFVYRLHCVCNSPERALAHRIAGRSRMNKIAAASGCIAASSRNMGRYPCA